jgi:hypothetical protein
MDEIYKVWCRAACSRDSGRSRRVCSAASNSLAHAPTPGSKAFRRYREQSPWRADRHKARPHRRLSPRTQGHCSRTADNARLNAHFLRDGTSAATISRQQHYSRPPHLALRCGRCPAARLKHLPYLRLEPIVAAEWASGMSRDTHGRRDVRCCRGHSYCSTTSVTSEVMPAGQLPAFSSI